MIREDVPPTVSNRGFRTDIQGLRAISVTLVVLYHASSTLVPGGFVGVDVFFVISGFLITGHLARSLRETGRIRFGEFYARRARRILPASFVVLGATVAASALLGSPLMLANILRDGIATALYVPNVAFAVQQTDYLGSTSPSPFQHYWSLGVEEQFYLFWPLLLFAVVRLTGSRPALRIAAIGFVLAVSFFGCLLVAQTSQPWAFFSLPTRAWELAAGGLVALLAEHLTRVPEPLRVGAMWFGLAGILWSAFTFDADTHYPGTTTVIPVLGAALFIAGGVRAARLSPDVVLRRKPVQALGAISYSLYLVHWPILVLASVRSDSVVPLGTRLALMACAVPLAWLLYRFVEMPFIRSTATTIRRPRAVLAMAAITSLLSVGVFASAGPAVAALPIASTRLATDAALKSHPIGTPFVPSNLHPNLTGAGADTGELYTNGCQQAISKSALSVCTYGNPRSTIRIALFGDSHAGRLFPALETVARSWNVRLDTYVKSACKSEDLDYRWPGPGSSTCTPWRQEAIAALNQDPPDVIVLVNHLGLATDAPGQTAADWTRGLEHSIERLPAASQIVTIADTPEFAFSPTVCLSAHLEDARACDGQRASLFNASVASAQREAAARTGSVYIDLSDYFCTSTRCPPIIGKTLVYADSHHLTATFASRLAAPLGRALAPFIPPTRHAPA